MWEEQKRGSWLRGKWVTLFFPNYDVILWSYNWTDNGKILPILLNCEDVIRYKKSARLHGIFWLLLMINRGNSFLRGISGTKLLASLILIYGQFNFLPLSYHWTKAQVTHMLIFYTVALSVYKPVLPLSTFMPHLWRRLLRFWMALTMSTVQNRESHLHKCMEVLKSD
jgi:hypothetical protein